MSIDLVDIKELSKISGIKESWWRKQVFEDAVPYYRIRRLIRFSLLEIKEWIESQKQGSLMKK